MSIDWTHRTLIVPAAHVELARTLCAGLAGAGGANMFTTALSPTGTEPATHYVSSGLIDAMFVTALSDAGITYALAQQVGLSVTLAEIETLLVACDISEEAPFEAFARLNLEITNV